MSSERARRCNVVSYASTGATAIWNVLRSDSTILLAEGLDVFRIPVPAELGGRPLAASQIRPEPGCSVVAMARADRFDPNPDANAALPEDAELLIGDVEAEHRFHRRFPRDGLSVGARALRAEPSETAGVRGGPPPGPPPRSG